MIYVAGGTCRTVEGAPAAPEREELSRSYAETEINIFMRRAHYPIHNVEMRLQTRFSNQRASLPQNEWPTGWRDKDHLRVTSREAG